VLVASDQWYPDLRGGAARVATDTAAALAARGHDVAAVAPSASADVRLRLRRCGLPQTLVDPIATAVQVRRLRAGADVVLAHQATVAFGVELAAPRLPVAYVFHASAAREAAFDEQHGAPRRRLAAHLLRSPLAALELRALRRAARVLVLSEYSASLAALVCPEVLPKLEVVGGGVDSSRFEPGDGRARARSRLGVDTRRPLLLTVRRLEPRMGIDLLLEAVSLLDVDLVIGGTGSLDESLREHARRLGLERRVRFAGRVSDDELVDWYRAADAFVLPTVAYEGFGVATAEALACGTPVVGTAVGATPELLAPVDGRLVAASPDPTALADAVATVLSLDQADLRRRCRRHAVAELAWDVVAARWEGALLRAAGPRPSADERWTFFERRRAQRGIASPR
jgi:glycosyltransferase involved in cell wall biosynthesis